MHAQSAHALETGGSAAYVVCPQLAATPERAAAFEARALLELTLRKVQGQVTVSCPDHDIEVIWAPITGDAHIARINPHPDDTLIDRLIAVLEPLTQQTPIPPKPPEPAPPPPAPPQRPEHRWGASASSIVEAWAGLDQASLGLSLGGALELEPWRLSLTLLAQQLIGRASGVELTAYRARMGIDYALVRGELGLELGTGFTAGAFIAEAPQPIAPSSLHSWATAVSWRLRSGYMKGPFWLVAGPEAHVNLARPVLSLGPNEVGPVTALTWGLSAELLVWF